MLTHRRVEGPLKCLLCAVPGHWWGTEWQCKITNCKNMKFHILFSTSLKQGWIWTLGDEQAADLHPSCKAKSNMKSGWIVPPFIQLQRLAKNSPLHIPMKHFNTSPRLTEMGKIWLWKWLSSLTSMKHDQIPSSIGNPLLHATDVNHSYSVNIVLNILGCSNKQNFSDSPISQNHSDIVVWVSHHILVS